MAAATKQWRLDPGRGAPPVADAVSFLAAGDDVRRRDLGSRRQERGERGAARDEEMGR